MAVTFGEDGFWLYLDGQLVDSRSSFKQGLDTNNEVLAIGANIWGRSASDPYYARNHFAGTIKDFTVDGVQLGAALVAEIAGKPQDPPLSQPTVVGNSLQGTFGNDTLAASDHPVTEVFGDYGNDVITGSDFDDILNGGHGVDHINGGDGNDTIISRADGREPKIAQNYTSEDDPNGEIDPISNTLYPDQPIEADDVLIGGLVQIHLGSLP